MKKIKLLTILLMFIFITNVNALTLTPTGEEVSKKGEEISIFLSLEDLKEGILISGVDGIINYDNKVFELVNSYNLLDNWLLFGKIANGLKFAYANIEYNNLLSTSQNINHLIFKTKDDAIFGDSFITVTNASATNEFGDDVEIIGGNHKVRILSDINFLKDIILENVKIQFNENKTEYDLSTVSDTTSITAIPKDENSTIKGDLGNQKLEYGNNIFKIIVTSETGKDKKYTLNINRQDNRSKDNNLSDIKLNYGDLKFDSTINNYEISVEHKVDEIDINAVLSDTKASFINGYGPRKVKLNIGDNIILIKVKAENEIINTYTLKIIRQEEIKKDENVIKPLSDNNYLSDIKINNKNISFNKKEGVFNITVENNISSIDLKLKTEDELAKYEILGDLNLNIGENIILIRVKAQNGNIRDYLLNINRKEGIVKLSNNSKLKTLSINGYKIDFNKNKLDYVVKINNESELDILYSLDDEKSNVIILGNENLQDNSKILVIVMAEDNSKTEYVINVLKNSVNQNNQVQNNNTNNNISTINFPLVSLIIFVFIGILLLIILNKKIKKTSNNK